MGHIKKPENRTVLVRSAIMILPTMAVAILCLLYLGAENILIAMMMIVQALILMKAGITEQPGLVLLKILIVDAGSGFLACVITSLAAAAAEGRGNFPPGTPFLLFAVGGILNMVTLFLLASVMFRDYGMKIHFPYILCYIYMMGSNPITFSAFPQRLLILLAGALLSFAAYAVGYKKAVKKEYGTQGADICLLDPRSIRFSYAFRLAVGVTILWLVVRVFDLEYGRWLILSFNSITLPYISDAPEKLKARLAGTFVGVIFFIMLFAVFANPVVRLIVMVIVMYAYDLCFATRQPYSIRMLLQTILTLGTVALCGAETAGFAFQRPVYVLVGGCLAILSNRFIFRHNGAEKD